MAQDSATTELKYASREAMDVARWIAKNDGSKINLSRHAKEQMAARGLVFRDIERVLQCGEHCTLDHSNPNLQPEWGKNDGEVRIVVTFQPKGAREVAVATIVVSASKEVFIKTVMWKDEQ